MQAIGQNGFVEADSFENYTRGHIETRLNDKGRERADSGRPRSTSRVWRRISQLRKLLGSRAHVFLRPDCPAYTKNRAAPHASHRYSQGPHACLTLYNSLKYAL